MFFIITLINSSFSKYQYNKISYCNPMSQLVSGCVLECKLRFWKRWHGLGHAPKKNNSFVWITGTNVIVYGNQNLQPHKINKIDCPNFFDKSFSIHSSYIVHYYNHDSIYIIIETKFQCKIHYCICILFERGKKND